MSLAERVLQRYKGAANKALTDAEYRKAVEDAETGLEEAVDQLDVVRENLNNIALTLKDRGHFRDASTLMEMTSGLIVSEVDSLTHMLTRLKNPPADIRKPAPAKPGKPENPWTKPLGR